MSGKRPSLADSMRQAVQSEAAPVVPPILPNPPARQPAETRQEPIARPTGFYAATRAGKKKVTATLSPATHKQLKSLAVERDSTTEALLAEAIGDLFQKYGKRA